MKLSPPASSSDLETAREIARRLHQRRRREDHPATAGVGRPAPQPPPAPRPVPQASSPVPERVPVEATPEPPSWDEPVGDGAATRAPEAHQAFAGIDDVATATAVESGGEAPSPDSEVEGARLSTEELVGAPEPSFEELPEPDAYAASPSPFEVELDEAETSEEEADDAPVPPSWDEIVEACIDLAQARGAMLVDPAGQVFAAQGDWPEPGPQAIAAKLVATMSRTLRDAPTRSISAPLMGMHLTAWRVPLSEGLVTAAFIGDTPVRAEARPAIDTEIHRGAGA